jgi:Tol biopolymer transport system component
VRLTENSAFRPVFSPDGKFISCAYFDEQAPSAQWRLAIIPSEGGRPVKLFDVPDQTINALAGIRWTPDSSALVYIDTHHGVSNVWSRPLDGGPAKQLTHFDSGQIFNLALTPDGRQLALARGTVSGDVVLISDFR